MNVAIIGGGAAGMMAAITAANNGHKVNLFEKNEKLGKKIYITGKGRCNVTNSSDIDVLFKNIVTNEKFMYSAFYTLTNDTFISMLNEWGLETKNERGNRVFPASDKSVDVIKCLEKQLKNTGVNVHLNTEIKDIVVEDNVAKGIVFVDGTKEFFDKIIVATGGFSYKTTGSTGDGYKFAKKYGHKVTDILPALVPLNIKEEFYKELQGLSLKNVEVTFFRGNKEIYKDFGEMLFTHFGVSGPLILSGSSYVSKFLANHEEIRLILDLKPALSKETLDDRIVRDFSTMLNKDFRNSLNELLPKKLIPVIIERTGISPYKKVNEITKNERMLLVNTIKEFEMTAISTRDFNEAIITQGGINVKEINPGTMESKLINNLYFIGEVLDVDALTGGYNLQVAWSTGYLCAINL